MDIKKINEGDVIKNYKEMCNLLGENILSGCSKKAQLKEWERYFDFGRKGQKFIIEKIYDIPKPVTLRENAVYVKAIELLLMYELSKKPGNCCRYTKTNLFRLLGMINDSYAENKKYTVSNKLKEYKNWEVRHFYGRTNQKLSEILFSALNSMKRRCLIEYREQNIIVERTDDNELIYKIASPSETELILQAKKNVLAEMGYTKIPFIKFDEFYEKVNEKLKELYDWNCVFREYEIIYNREFMKNDIVVVEKEIKDELREKQIKLNCDIISAINKQADKLFEKNRNNFLKSSFENDSLFEESDGFENKKFYYPDNYIDVQNDLAEFLLRI